MPSAASGRDTSWGSSSQFTTATVHQRDAPSATQVRGGRLRRVLQIPALPSTRTASTFSPPQFSVSVGTRYRRAPPASPRPPRDVLPVSAPAALVTHVSAADPPPRGLH